MLEKNLRKVQSNSDTILKDFYKNFKDILEKL